MKSLPLAFALLFALSLCSFAIFHTQEAAPIEESMRTQYLAAFRKVEFPYTISAENREYKKKARFARDYKHFISGLSRGNFSRMGPSYYYPDAILTSNDKFDAVLYVEEAPYGGDIGTFTLQTIDKKGDIIATRNIADDYAMEQGAVTVIDEKLNITTEEVKFDYAKRDADNQPTMTKTAKKFRISAEGKIIEING